MFGDVFYWLFSMSIVASVAGAVILLLRQFGRIPRRVICLLWVIPCVRMWLPFGINSRFGLMTLLNEVRFKKIRVIRIGRIGAGTDITWTNMMGSTEGSFPLEYKQDLMKDLFGIAGIVWASVAAVLLILLAVLYLSTLRGVRGATHLRDDLYLSDRVSTPAVYGFFRPKIVLPTSTAEEDYPMILLHERAHIRRGDNLWRLLGFVTVALHWFNPLAWIFLRCFLSDTEQACDETALSSLDETGRKEYALALLRQAEARDPFPAAFGGAKLKTRIKRIVSFKKMTVFSAVGFGALVLAIAWILLTNAA